MTIEPLSAPRILHGIVIAAGCVVGVALVLVGLRALITGKVTGGATWADMPEDLEEVDRGTLERLQARADAARLEAAEKNAKSGRMRPSTHERRA